MSLAWWTHDTCRLSMLWLFACPIDTTNILDLCYSICKSQNCSGSLNRLSDFTVTPVWHLFCKTFQSHQTNRNTTFKCHTVLMESGVVCFPSDHAFLNSWTKKPDIFQRESRLSSDEQTWLSETSPKNKKLVKKWEIVPWRRSCFCSYKEHFHNYSHVWYSQSFTGQRLWINTTELI